MYNHRYLFSCDLWNGDRAEHALLAAADEITLIGQKFIYSPMTWHKLQSGPLLALWWVAIENTFVYTADLMSQTWCRFYSELRVNLIWRIMFEWRCLCPFTDGARKRWTLGVQLGSFFSRPKCLQNECFLISKAWTRKWIYGSFRVCRMKPASEQERFRGTYHSN